MKPERLHMIGKGAAIPLSSIMYFNIETIENYNEYFFGLLQSKDPTFITYRTKIYTETGYPNLHTDHETLEAAQDELAKWTKWYNDTLKEE